MWNYIGGTKSKLELVKKIKFNTKKKYLLEKTKKEDIWCAYVLDEKEWERKKRWKMF